MSEIVKLNTAGLNPLNQGPMTEKKNQVTEEKFREVSEMYEKHFIRQMLKEMRSTVSEGGFIKQNNAEKIFRDQLDDKYADEWGKSGGIGLADLIHNQLMDKFGTQLGLRAPVEKPKGPIELNEKSNFTDLRSPEAGTKKSVQLKFDGNENPQAKTSAVKNPWAGTLLDKKHLEMDQMQYRIKHDNGLESLILTRGSGLVEGADGDNKLVPGDAIQAGQQLGWREATSPLFWTIKETVSE